MLFVYLVAGLVFGLIGAGIADSKGRPRLEGFILGFVLSLIGLLVCMVLTPITPATDSARAANGLKRCPECAENIRVEALTCHFCRHAFDASQVEKDTATAASLTKRARRAGHARFLVCALPLVAYLILMALALLSVSLSR